MRVRSALLLAAAAIAPVAAPAQVTDHATLEQVMGEPVTSSVIGTPQRASDVPADVTIITRADIAAAPARDVPGLLQRYAGIDVTRYTAGQAEVAIRGGVQPYNARLLVLVDGRQVYLDHYGMTNWNLLGIQLEDIQQIEVVRGPASALFGFNAVTGVVNIITLDAVTGRAATLRADAGDHGIRRVGAVYAGPLADAVALRLSAGTMREDERRVPADITLFGASGPVTRDEVSGTLTGLLGARTRAIASAGYAWNAQQEFLPDGVLGRQRFRTGHLGGQVQHDTQWGALNARSYLNDLDARYGDGLDQPLVFRQRVLVSQASGVLRLGGGNAVRIGGEYRDNRLAMVEGVPGASYRLGSVAGTLDLHPMRGVAVSLAARGDRLMPRAETFLSWEGASVTARAPTLNAFSFNAGIVARLGARDQVRVNGGRGLALPSLIDIRNLTGVDPAEFRIRPDVVWSAEAGYRHDFGDTLTVDAGGYWSRNRQSYIFVFRDVGSYTSVGGAVSAHGRILPDLSWRANYTLAIVRPIGDATFAEQVGRAPWLSTPRHKANVALDYAASSRWSGAVAARYTSATRQPLFLPEGFGLRRIPDAVTVDARLGVRLTRRIGVRALAENLTDARGASGALIPADWRVRIGVEAAW